MLKWLLILLFFCPLKYAGLNAQETNSHASGRIFSEENEKLSNVNVTIVHEPTQNKIVTQTNDEGNFDIFNIKPGGPYSMQMTHAGFQTTVVTDLYIHLNNVYFVKSNEELRKFILLKKTVVLSEVSIELKKISPLKTGLTSNIPVTTIQTMPSINRDIYEFVRIIPQVKVTGEGAISFAGQNNRSNAFYIDGANNTDIQGLSANGMNGGQTGSPPISIEAIEELSASIAPYNPQYGNFTGGMINAVSRSGSNTFKSSAWYYFRNEKLAGKSPQAIENPSSPGEFYRPRLSPFLNQTTGFWNSGPVLKNRLFYFVLFEQQSDSRPQPYDMNSYRGNSNDSQLTALSAFAAKQYNYQTGSFREVKDQLNAVRVNLKLDYNLSISDKLSFSYRLNDATRVTPRVPSSPTSILFQNNGIKLPSLTNSFVLEWKHYFNLRSTNRLLFNYNNQNDDRQHLGEPFPSITIRDGTGSIQLGSDLNSGSYRFKANDFNLTEVFKTSFKKSVFTAGGDINLSFSNNRYIPAFFGSYSYRNLSDFFTESPFRLSHSYPLYDESSDISKYTTFKGSLYASNENKLSDKLRINYGLRLDVNAVLSKPFEDQFFNDSAINTVSGFYDLYGAKSGKFSLPQWTLSPRMEINYDMPAINLFLKAGGGLFTGRNVNLWTSDIFNSINGSIDINPQLHGLGFSHDPYDQPTASDLGQDPANYKGVLGLISRKFRQPLIFRTSFVAEKRFRKNWKLAIEGLYTKNVQETRFTNVNIQPPTIISEKPDQRNIYSSGVTAPQLELDHNGGNPYTQVILLSNNRDKKGYATSISLIISKTVSDFSLNTSYTYSKSKVLFEITGPQTPVVSQWRNMETVNGRNFASPSISDNDVQHRVTAWLSKQLSYLRGKTASTISIFYNGQSGIPYSYVYSNSMINDNGRMSENFDLIYIPTRNELTSMEFIPVRDETGALLSPETQKAALNSFIDGDKYLKTRRGNFASRNGARLPFTHQVDVKFQQDFNIKLKNQNLKLVVSYDIFNFLNFLNKNQGKIYSLQSDSYPIVTFAGYSTSNLLIPQYQFLPFNGKPYALQSSTLPGNSARWISQLGIKISLL